MSLVRLTTCLASGVAAGAALTAVLAAQAPATPRTYSFKADALASPSEPHPNPPKLLPVPEGATLTVPQGFTSKLFSSGGFKRPRMVAEAPNGDIFVVDTGAGSLWALRDANKNGSIEEGERSEFATGLKQPFGLAFGKGVLFVANTDAVVKFPYKAGDLKATAEAASVAPLPNGPAGHWTRNIALSPDGRSFYVSVGSSHNIDPDPDPLRATVLKFNLDGTGRETVVTGARNAVGLAFNLSTRELWMTVQERDGLGDELVHDYIAKVTPGRFYGWPYAYLGQHEDPRHAGKMPDLVKKTAVPEVLLEPHSSVLGLTFYNGSAFPAKYRTGAFAALRGSSNRTKRTGYKIVYVPFTKGQPTGSYEDFATGWMKAEDSPEVWGRPTDVIQLRDGSLLVVEDGNGTLWRIAYGK